MFTLQRKWWWIQKAEEWVMFLSLASAIWGSVSLCIWRKTNTSDHKGHQEEKQSKGELLHCLLYLWWNMWAPKSFVPPFQDFKQFLKRSVGYSPPLWGSSRCQQLHITLSASHNNQVREAKSFSLQVGILFRLIVHLVQIRNKSWLCWANGTAMAASAVMWPGLPWLLYCDFSNKETKT